MDTRQFKLHTRTFLESAEACLAALLINWFIYTMASGMVYVDKLQSCPSSFCNPV